MIIIIQFSGGNSCLSVVANAVRIVTEIMM